MDCWRLCLLFSEQYCISLNYEICVLLLYHCCTLGMFSSFSLNYNKLHALWAFIEFFVIGLYCGPSVIKTHNRLLGEIMVFQRPFDGASSILNAFH
jgi:hypothetical protein